MWPKEMFCIVLLISYSCSSNVSERFFDTKVGKIYGFQDREFSQFLGIPYGQIDDTDFFAPARPYPAFKTPFYATKSPEICTQIVKSTVKGNIHCLNLNIYVPNPKNVTRTYPVMVYIHGGAFIEGDANIETYSPKFLIKHDVIIVTINYRLGIYGFLCLKNTKYNNIGLKDQVLALKWIKDNIKAFGGNDTDITLFGHSAGATCADIHLLFGEEGLFNKAIIQSGVTISPAMLGYEFDDLLLKKTAQKMGFEGDMNDYNSVLKFLTVRDVDKLIKVSNTKILQPCIDGDFITEAPKRKSFDNIKIVIGNTDKEFEYYYPDTKEFRDNFNFKKELEKSFINVSEEMVNLVKDYYRENQFKDALKNFAFDIGILYPSDKTVKFYLNHNVTVFRYEFSYRGKRNLMVVRDNIELDGAAHGDEIGYLVDMTIFDGVVDANDGIMIDRMSKMWTNFVKYGDPSLTTPGLKLIWPPQTRNAKPFLSINSTFEIRSRQKRSVAFWELYNRLFQKQIKAVKLMETTLNDFECNETKKYGSMSYFMLTSFACVCVNIVLLSILLVIRAFRHRQ